MNFIKGRNPAAPEVRFSPVPCWLFWLPLPRWTGQIRPFVDTRKSGHFRHPETAREFYFMGSRICARI